MECDIRVTWIIKLLIFFRFASVGAIVLAKGPEDKTVYEGDTVTFECIVANRGASNILWVYNGKRFISADTVVFSHITDRSGLNRRSTIINSVSGQYKLKIFNVSKSDEGLFECYYSRNQVTKSFGKSGTARLRVLDIGTNTPICGTHASGSSDLRPFDKVVLNCSSASQNFAVKWKNGSNAMTKFQHGRQVIEITLTPFDNGRVFTCIEVNPATYKTQNCSVKPMDILPMADISPRKPEIAANSDITFTCNASGFPNIEKYSWVHDGYVIVHGAYYPMKYRLIGDGRRLTITGVGVTDNQSSIVCHAFVRPDLYDIASTTMTVKFSPVYITTNTPLTTRQRTLRPTDLTTDLILLQDDEYKHARAFALSLPAIIASVIAICIFIIVSGGLLMLAFNRKPKSMLDLPDITARRRRGAGTFIPSVSGGISHNNFIYSELFNDIDLQNKAPPDEYRFRSLHEDDILEPLLDEKGQSFLFETHQTSGLVAPPLPPKPSRLIAPDLYTEIPDEIYPRNEQPSPPCDDGILYCGTELSVRSSSETTDMLPEPDEIYYQVPDRTSLVIPEISEHCHSKVTKQWSRTPSPCGCDERSRTTCPSYARVKKGNKGNFGLGNLERRLLIPLKCDDLTSAELYDVNAPLLNFNLEQELCLKEWYTDQIYNAIPEEHAQHHHNSRTLMLPSKRSSRRCRSRLRRSKSCPKNNPYEEFKGDIIQPDSFLSNLRVAESAPNLIHAQACQTRGRHVYETVPDKVVDKLYKAKSDDILSKGSSDISDDVDSSEYMDMEYVDVSDYI